MSRINNRTPENQTLIDAVYALKTKGGLRYPDIATSLNIPVRRVYRFYELGKRKFAEQPKTITHPQGNPQPQPQTEMVFPVAEVKETKPVSEAPKTKRRYTFKGFNNVNTFKETVINLKEAVITIKYKE